MGVGRGAIITKRLRNAVLFMITSGTSTQVLPARFCLSLNVISNIIICYWFDV